MRRYTLLSGVLVLFSICMLSSGIAVLPYILAAGWIVSGIRTIAWDEEGMSRGILKILCGLLLLASPFLRMSLGLVTAVYAMWFVPVILFVSTILLGCLLL